jgi:arsenate reductase-like glutaredoxin family protein
MPAPLGKTPTKKMPKIDVLGIEDSAATRSAVRFFRERRIVVRFVDLRKKTLSPAELRDLLDRLGPALLDTGGLAPEDAAELATDRGKLMAAIHADVRLLKLPLVRYGDAVTAGQDEAAWRGWLAGRNGSGSAR